MAVVVAVVVRSFVAEAYYIPSASMTPQLQVDDRVVVSRLSYDLHTPHRGDIVVFAAPAGVLPADRLSSDLLLRGLDALASAIGLSDGHDVLIKRVVALPGETVEGRGGHVLVDGRILVEPYLASGTATSTFGPFRIHAGAIWVMGDNRGNSEDSRVFGPVNEHRVVGRAIWRVWPPGRVAFL
ncbi:MAG: signal peptidase I [Acidimicrobiales bacterium]